MTCHLHVRCPFVNLQLDQLFLKSRFLFLTAMSIYSYLQCVSCSRATQVSWYRSEDQTPKTAWRQTREKNNLETWWLVTIHLVNREKKRIKKSEMATHWQYRCLASLNVEAGTDCGQHFLFIYDYLLFPGSLFPSHNSTVLVPGIRKIRRKGTEHCWRLSKSAISLANLRTCHPQTVLQKL